MFAGVFVVAAAVVMLPGAPLVPILVGTQALNAVLLLAVLPFLIVLSRDRELMRDHVAGPGTRIATTLAFALVAASIVLLAGLQLAR